MLIAIIGENCVGKSTLANQINEKRSATIYSGKDYLRLEKSPSVALEKFIAESRHFLIKIVFPGAGIPHHDPDLHIRALPKAQVQLRCRPENASE